MLSQSLSSVVRLLAVSLFLLMLSACTAQYTREVGRAALRDIGLGTSVKITRSGSWSLPEGTAVHLAPTFIEGGAYPRLSGHLDRLLESITSEWFHGEGLPAESDVLLHVSLVDAADRLSSVHEIANSSGMTQEMSGRDRLYLVMKVYDARTGQLMDTMSGEAISGWRWREHRVADLAEPTLRVMFARLRGVTASIE